MSRACFSFVILALLSVTVAGQEKKKPTKKKQRTQEITVLAKELKGTANKKYEGTTVDIETDDLVINVAWAEPNSWEPAVGQSLHHSLIAEKRPAVLLLRVPGDDGLVQRCHDVCRSVGIRLMLRDIDTHKSTDSYTPDPNELKAVDAIRERRGEKR